VVKWPGRENDHSPLLSTEVKNVLNNTATLPHASSVHIQLYCQLTIHNLCCGNITLKKSQIKPCIINKWRGQGHVINLNRIVTVTTATAVCTHPLTHVRMHAHVHTHTHTHKNTSADACIFVFYLEEIHSLQGNQGSSLVTLAFNIFNAGTKKFILQ